MHRALQWRKALEQALWQERLRLETRAAAPPEPPRPASAAAGMTMLPGVASPSAQGDAVGARSAAPQGAAAYSTEEFVFPRAAAAIGRATSMSPGAIALSPGFGARAPAAGEVTARVPAAAPARLEAPTWSETFAHVAIRAEGVVISIRDPRLLQSHHAETMIRLVRELREWGLELAELTINGQPVVAARQG